MKVKELIEILQGVDGSLEVGLYDWDYCRYAPVSTVEVVDGIVQINQSGGEVMG